MATLRRLTIAGLVEAEIPLDRAELVLGRGQECDVVIGEKLVSRRHARIVRTAQGGHLLLDEASNIGVMMGETRVSHRELREGDVFQIGFVRFQYTLGGSARGGRAQTVVQAAGGRAGTIAVVLVVLAVVGGAIAALVLTRAKGDRQPSSSGGDASPSQVGEMVALGAEQFVDANHELTATIATLNRAEQQLISHAGGRDPAVIDEDLRAIAGAALDAGLTAGQLADTVAVNDRGAGGTAMREQYQAIARAGYALMIEAQDARDQVARDPAAGAAAATMIAEYGARLWNPEVHDGAGGNPFLALTKGIADPVPVATMVPRPAGATAATWMSSSRATVTRRLTFAPDAAAAPDLSISALQKMTTAAGQTDGRAARAVAINKLAGVGANLDGGGAVVRMFAGISVVDLAESGGKALDKIATLVPGTASTVEKIKDKAAKVYVEDFLDGLNHNPLNPDLRIAQTPPPTVKVVIGRVNRPADATGQVHVDVSWEGPAGTPDLTIVCQIPGYGNVEAAGAGSGKARLIVPLGSAPASPELGVHCSARDPSGAVLGWKEIATTPTSDPLIDAGVPDGGAAAADAEPARTPDAAPAASAVDAREPELSLSWIEPYVKTFEESLLAKRPDDEVAIAIVTADLRTCLHAAVEAGKDQETAKKICAKALKEGKPPELGAGAGSDEPPPAAKGWAGSFAGTLTARVTHKGKTRSINVPQVLTIKYKGSRLVLTNKEGEPVSLAISGDGKTATGSAAVEDVEQDVTVTLDGDTLVLRSTFRDADGAGGSVGGTLTRQ